MAPSTPKSFTAVLEPLRNNLGWVIARIPFDIDKAWPNRLRLRVRGEIEGFAFRTSLFAFSNSEGHFLLVNKKMQSAAKAAIGSKVRISLQPDLEERVANIPPEMARALQGERRLRKYFDKLSYSMRKDIERWVSDPKSPASRQKRAEQLAERLFFAMEGEAELPPILHAAFLRQPQARIGWEAMTPNQRRNSLMAIFYYQSPDAANAVPPRSSKRLSESPGNRQMHQNQCNLEAALLSGGPARHFYRLMEQVWLPSQSRELSPKVLPPSSMNRCARRVWPSPRASNIRMPVSSTS